MPSESHKVLAVAINNKVGDRSCGTCRDRRILCNRAVPICAQCSRSKRHCKGYAIRLSWPNGNDAKRSKVGKPARYASRPRYYSDARHVHVSSWDIEMHYYMTASEAPNNYTGPTLYMPLLWSPLALKNVDKDLFQYFQLTAAQSLTTFGHNPTKVGDIILRVALASDTSSAIAVLKSLLALSSLHRYGIQAQAVELKIAALKALATASQSNFGTKEAIQHIAAGLLLCSFEIHQSSCTSSQWTWYICGIKEVISKVSLSKHWRDSEFTTLVDWVYYQDVLARFSFRHWGREVPKIPPSPPDMCSEVSRRSSSNFAILRLISEVCDTVPTRPPENDNTHEFKEYKGFLQILDWRIRSVSITASAGEGLETTTVLELYQLALLVYVHRLSGELLDEPVKTQQRVEKAFEMLAQVESCERQFPVFILGCEARTDEQRAVILDLISRTEKNVSSRSFLFVRLLLQAIWAQDDLAGRELHYWDKLSSIISCASILPTFV